uniref:Uncharacterized protein n=1 Tax=Plectus sambesii TaxID=2011161 RepID=A0A914WQU0_9BILA
MSKTESDCAPPTTVRRGIFIVHFGVVVQWGPGGSCGKLFIRSWWRRARRVRVFRQSSGATSAQLRPALFAYVATCARWRPGADRRALCGSSSGLDQGRYCRAGRGRRQPDTRDAQRPSRRFTLGPATARKSAPLARSADLTKVALIRLDRRSLAHFLISPSSFHRRSPSARIAGDRHVRCGDAARERENGGLTREMRRRRQVTSGLAIIARPRRGRRRVVGAGASILIGRLTAALCSRVPPDKASVCSAGARWTGPGGRRRRSAQREAPPTRPARHIMTSTPLRSPPPQPIVVLSSST